MDMGTLEQAARERARRECDAAQAMLMLTVGMAPDEAVSAVVLALGTLCAGMAQDKGGNADGAADLTRRMMGVAEACARRNFGRVRRTPVGRH